MNKLAREGVGGGMWRLPAGRELDMLVAELVFGMGAGAGLAPEYSTDAGAMWQVVALLAPQMGYERAGFAWHGPLYKPEHRYLTHEGYGLGATCWYVALEEHGLRWNVCAATPMLAVCWAALELGFVRLHDRADAGGAL